MGRNVTLTLDPEVLAGARALAKAAGVPLSTWLATKVRREVHEYNARTYAAWWEQHSSSNPEITAFDRAASDTTTVSWTGSEW